MECFPKFCIPIVWYIFIINREDRKFEHGGERGDEVTIGGTRMIDGINENWCARPVDTGMVNR